ncbi:MAG: glycosyltransferase family 4 protein [Anaerolineaceae bacterium]
MRTANGRVHPLHIGFVSTRFAGTDGVSLESKKWAAVLGEIGCRCFYFAGECDQPPEISRVVPLAFFRNPEINAINQVAFFQHTRPPEITRRIQDIKIYLKDELNEYIRQYAIDLLLVENALSIPLNLSLGLALTELIAETGIPVIAHHHDMFWERKRFLVNCVWDYLNMSFPPHLPTIQHVVINSSAANQLSLRTGISNTLIPNAMDFDHPPAPPDDYTLTVRRDLGIAPDEYFLLQPTRVVQRKGIEHAIELVSRLNLPAKLVISHASGDEGYEYEQRVRDYAMHLNAPTLFVSDIIAEKRGDTPDGRRVYTRADLYPHADLVTYPSDIEGFGNAFLETLYYRRPIVVNKYSIYDIDIKPKGFHAIEFDGYITEQTVEHARQVLTDPILEKEMTESNYQIASRHYSYRMLHRRLETLLRYAFGE